MAKCPHCKKDLVRSVKVERTTATDAGGQGPWNCFAYVCRHCDSLLSIQVDPLAVKKEVVEETVADVRELLRDLKNL